MEDLLNKYRTDCCESCASVESIREITDRYRYEDDEPGGDGDSPKVSCGQNGNYCELEYIYDKYLDHLVERGQFSEEEAVRALCETCCELDSPRERDEFYEMLGNKLSIKIP